MLKFARPCIAAATLVVTALSPLALSAATTVKPTTALPPVMTANNQTQSRFASIAARVHQQLQSHLKTGITPQVEVQSSKPKFENPRDRALASLKARMSTKGMSAHPDNILSPTGSASVNFPGFQGPDILVNAGIPNDLSPTYSSLTLDVNQDGLPDIVNIQIDGSLSVLLNPGGSKLSSLAVSSTNLSATSGSTAIEYAYTADLNGDKFPDIIAIDYTADNMYVFLNKKDGTFANATVYPLDFSAAAAYGEVGGVAIGDVNGDGIPDIVALGVAVFTPDFSSTTEQSLTFIGKGDGTFATPLVGIPQIVTGIILTSPNQLQLADMNKDGKLDLVVLVGETDSNNNEAVYPVTFNGDGSGLFNDLPAVIPATGSVPNVSDSNLGGFLVQDIDGDGILDVLFAYGSDSVYFAHGNGDGTFANAVNALSGMGKPSIVTFADVNGDGKLDAIAYTNGMIAIYPGKGSGTFSSTMLANLASGAGGDQQPTPADFNDDGQIDIVDTDYALSTVGIYEGLNGTFHSGTVLVPSGEVDQNFDVLATADLTGKGFSDVIAADLPSDYYSPSPNIVGGFNDGKGNFTYSTIASSDVLEDIGATGIEAVVDLNGDGLADLVFGTYQGVSVAYNQGNGVFGTPVPLMQGFSNICPMSAADVGDLNGDGRPDIVVAYQGDAICSGPGLPSGFITLINNGGGSFSGSFTAYGQSAFMPKLVDLNGDGVLDLAMAEFNQYTNLYGLTVIPGSGGGQFAIGSATQLLPATAIVTSVIAGDFDADGKQDLAVGVLSQLDSSGSDIYDTTGLLLMKGHGDFTFDLGVQYANGLLIQDGKFADINGDGYPDLVLNVEPSNIYNVQDSGFVYLPNLGNGTFGPLKQTLSAPSQGGSIFVADFNGDGAPDVLNSDGVGSSLYLNTGAINLTLATSATTSVQDSAVTLTASFAAPVSTKQPTGTVSFYANGVLLNSVNVSSNGATLTLSELPVGADMITAKYSGDANFNAATAGTSVSVTVSALAPSFTLTAPTPGTLNLAEGQAGIATLSLTGNGTFNGSVQLTCTGATVGIQCLVSTPTVTLSSGQSYLATIAVATQGKATNTAENRLPNWMGMTSGLSMAGAFLFLSFSRRRRNGLNKLMMVLLLTLGASAYLSGCSNGGNNSQNATATPVGSTNLIITATSGSITQTQTLAVVVTAAP